VQDVRGEMTWETRRRRKKIILKWIFKESVEGHGLLSLWIRTSVRLLWTRHWTFGFHKIRGNFLAK